MARFLFNVAAPTAAPKNAAVGKRAVTRAIIVTGSHAGLLGGKPDAFLDVDVFAAIFNDAGGGKDDAVVTVAPSNAGCAMMMARRSTSSIGTSRAARTVKGSKSFQRQCMGESFAPGAIGDTEGVVKIIAEKRSDGTAGRILGVHMVGPWVTEQLGQAYLAVNWEANADEVAKFIQPHPTLSELFGESVLALTGRSLHG